MGKKIHKPSAEESKEPQNIDSLDQEETTLIQEITLEVIDDQKIQNKTQESTTEIETKKEIIAEPFKKDEDKVKKITIHHDKASEIDYSKLNIQELIEAFSKISTSDQWLRSQAKIQNINRLFEEKFHKDVEANKKVFINEGGNEIDFFYKPEYKKQFDQIGYEYRKKKRTHYKEQEVSHKVNLERKKNIIEEIKGLISADKNINTIYKKFRTLQESWYSTGPVSRAENQNLWETFKHHVERFYDFLHLNRELRELDFKHNYEEKLKIIERAEALKDLPDIMRASRDLNILHQLWKNDLGPVAKEHREALWNRFQKATKTIQTRRQEYQKDISGAMKENLEKKKAMLKEMKNLTEKEPKNHNSWQNTLKKFNELRESFKNIGYVPSKESKITWQEFREIGRNFMQKKNIFYKHQKKEYSQNIKAKKDLISKSKNFLNDSEWDSMVGEMKNIQKEWKSIGFVPRKLDNALWSDFSLIHKKFFDRIKSGYQYLRPEQEELKKEKMAAIEVLNTSKFSENPEELSIELTKSFDCWNAIPKIGGQIEFELNRKFTGTLTKIVGEVSLDKKAQKKVLFKLDSILLQNDPDKLQKKLSEVKSSIGKYKTELTQLQNNLEFFSQSSSENPLFKNVEKQIKSCQTKIDKFNEEYIRLRQINKSQMKLASQEVNKEDNESEKNQKSETD